MSPRIVRGGRNLIYIKGGAVPLTDPVTTATTPTTTTKSPEQLLREKEVRVELIQKILQNWYISNFYS